MNLVRTGAFLSASCSRVEFSHQHSLGLAFTLTDGFTQVREAVGSLISKLGANLLSSSQAGQAHIAALRQSSVYDWTSVIVEGTRTAAETILSKGVYLGKSSVDDASSDSSKEALKRVETVSTFFLLHWNTPIFLTVYTCSAVYITFHFVFRHTLALSKRWL